MSQNEERAVVGCQEPTGISMVPVLCEDLTVGNCQNEKCGMALCTYHLSLHKHRHEVLDKIAVFRAACDKCNAAFTGESQKLAESYLNFHKKQKHERGKKKENDEY